MVTMRSCTQSTSFTAEKQTLKPMEALTGSVNGYRFMIKQWPVINVKIIPLPEAEKCDGVKGKVKYLEK